MWWQVNMGSQQTFNQVVLNSGGNTGDYADGYDVEVSNDGTNFTPVYFGTGTSAARDRDVLPADRPVHPDPAHRVLDGRLVVDDELHRGQHPGDPADRVRPGDRRQPRLERVRVHPERVGQHDPEPR